jgi:outer membrane protein insertion porin family
MHSASKIALIGLGLIAAGPGILAGQGGDNATAGPCARPDSITFTGNTRTSSEMLRQDVGIPVRQTLSAGVLERAIKQLYATGQYEDIVSECVQPDSTSAILRFTVKEFKLLKAIDVTGVERVSQSSVRDRIDLLIGRPVNPAQVARSVAKIDSVYAAGAYYLARVRVDTSESDGELSLMFHVDEGRRMAISGIQIEGNSAVSDADIVKAMQTKPERFFWWQEGEFDEDKFASDIAEQIPRLYATRGFIDMQVIRDTVIVDRDLGKAYLQITVREGPQYKVGSFEVTGSKHFPVDVIGRFYPFNDTGRGLTDVVFGVFRRSGEGQQVFNRAAWESATAQVMDAYSNEGYIYAKIDPVVERDFAGKDSTPTVNLRWEIREQTPAIVNRIDIVGNDFTSEGCIRDQLFILPGDIFNKDRLLRSYQNIGNLGFFETPLPSPDQTAANEKGDINLIFRVKEKKTGAVNFGASVGQGTGVGGFVGFDQPNLFGLCKRGSLQWQFGQYINDFSLTYSDPRIRGSRVSGTATAYHSRSRFIIQDIGRTTRTGGQVRFGFPLLGSRVTRLYVDYGGEKVKYGDEGLVSTINCNNCFRSTLGGSIEHDTRVGMPFPIGGVRQAFAAQFNGGPLGGSSSFARYTTEMRSTATLATIGGTSPGSEPFFLTFTLALRAGALFGDPGPFFVSQSFSLGGTQYGEPLRGYEEFSITPNGFVPNASQFQAQRSSFGNAFYASTAEMGLRINQQLYVSAFYDAGNLWSRPRDFDPTRLFRGAGFGALIVTPLGPLGIDLGYGFDRINQFGQRDPKWQAHFKFGQVF